MRSAIRGGLVALSVLGARSNCAPAQPGPLATFSHDELVAAAYSITTDVEELRGLRFERAVPVETVDDARARQQFLRRAARFWPEAQMRAEQQVYAHLGLVPPGTDLQAVLLDVLEEQAGGYYDPEADTFFVLDDMPRALAPIILAHELTHALDDQHFDIDPLLERVKDDADRSLAVGSVVEGSGTLVMSVFMLREIQAGRLGPEAVEAYQESELGRAERLLEAPALLQRLLLGPYVLGQSFLLRGDAMRLMAGLDPDDLNRAFREPPRSSEQVLHPEKYWDPERRDEPRHLALGDLSSRLGDGWRLEAEGDLGELVLATLVGAAMPDLHSIEVAQPSAWTNAAAAGWGGDRWQLYARGEARLTILATCWDAEAEAREFEAALPAQDGRQAWRRGDAVVLVAGEAGGRAEELARAHLEALARR
jgi:hypothetical protein